MPNGCLEFKEGNKHDFITYPIYRIILKDYIEYFKDNPHHYWFKAKVYGWGWTPATWEGWTVVLIFLIAIIANGYRIDSASHSVSDTLLNFIPQTVILVFLLIVICYIKGEPPHWQWGLPKKK